jgi:bla regulator protein BlaR1
MIGKILLAGFVCAGMAVGQTTSPSAVAAPVAPAVPATAAAGAAPAKAYVFEVVSIRQNISEMQGDFGKPTADGYRMINSSLGLVMNTAYVPQVGGAAFYSPGQEKGLPEWANSERYDIDARISDADREAWQNPAKQKMMLQSMLQAMLVERCKLVVHREIKDASVYSLVIGKSGIKFKETNPAVDPPSGQKLPWGGVVANSRDGRTMSFYGASMASLASLLSNILSGMGLHDGTVQDKTGLTGRYDFVIKFPPIEPRGQNDAQGAPPADDPSLVAFTAVAALGLKLEKDKGQVETLVIDHMERPSVN